MYIMYSASHNLQYNRLVIGTVHVWITVVLFLLYQLQPNQVPVNLWVKEKKKWSKKTQPAAVLSKKFVLYKAAKVSLCLVDVQYMGMGVDVSLVWCGAWC